jgi:DNA-binding PadR family transcriptional regulator/polyisoprenoid-binding protein YceI
MVMDDSAATAGWRNGSRSRFDLTPPRHFVLPAILLLLSEEPGYGYHLAQRLTELRFGRVDRPSVYRALAQLESDGLVESAPSEPRPGQPGHERRVYGVTEHGERVLRAWMGVIKEERDRLDNVLRRYMATGTLDAVLAEVEGGWASVTGPAWSPVSSTSWMDEHWPRYAPTPSSATVDGDDAELDGQDASTSRFRLVPERSVALVEARSTVGPITFGVIGVTGTIDVAVNDGGVVLDNTPAAHVEIQVDELRSGNRLYDAELLRRIDARRHPVVALDLRECAPAGSANRFRLAGDVTIHGVTRAIHGTVSVAVGRGDRLVVQGDHVIDVRDFDIESPTVLMLRIYPDVRVQLQVEAERES